MVVSKLKNFAALLLFAFGAAVTIAYGIWFAWPVVNGNSKGESSFALPESAVILPEVDPNLYFSISNEGAVDENEKIPFANAVLERALPFSLPSDDFTLAGRMAAVDCLTAAIYYEAGNEGITGKRGVAQVIVNRARHPAFPNSICGVVYQGSERRTGCQFTFTCDGSIERRPSRSGWQSAREVAISAISGFVEPSVGMATHYHANYVLPYWAHSLDKVAVLDTHIFYQWRGAWGRRHAFDQRIRFETLPQAREADDFPIILTEVVGQEDGVALSSVSNTQLSRPNRPIIDEYAPPARTEERVTSPLSADQNQGSLVVDENVGTLVID